MRVIHSPLVNGHIDLDSISMIEDASFVDEMGRGGFFVAFRIHLKLHDEPFSRARVVKQGRDYRRIPDKSHAYELRMVDGSWRELSTLKEEKDIAAVREFQDEIDELIAQWKAG